MLFIVPDAGPVYPGTSLTGHIREARSGGIPQRPTRQQHRPVRQR